MFVDIDYRKKIKDYSLHLAKPNKKILTNLYERINTSDNIKLGNINELSFSIPYYIDKEYNKHIDLIKEKMLIKFTLGTYVEWYVIDEIEDSADDTELCNVKCFSLGYELTNKRILSFVYDAINPINFLINALSGSVWNIGEIDPLFENMYRSFDISSTNILDCITQGAETYGALIQWDTINKTVSFLDPQAVGKFRGMTVNYGKFIQSISKKRTTDEMVTRLYVYGAEELSIHSVNPTGQGFLEDFSFFMYPFERDEKKNVIKKSNYMSDELCNALLDNSDVVYEKAPLINDAITQINIKNKNLNALIPELKTLEGELENISVLLDLAKSTGNAETIATRELEKSNKQKEVTAKQDEINALNISIKLLQAELDSLQLAISIESNFSQALLDELNFYIIEKEWRDDKYIDEQELYDDAVKKFNEIRQPKVVIDVSIDNLFNIIEEQYYWDKIVLGDLIKVKYPQMNIEYTAKIIEINYDLENQEIDLVVANTSELLNDTERLQQLLYNNSSATSIVEGNKYKWDKISNMENEVTKLIESGWDANQKRIIAGVNNSVKIDKRGITITDENYPNEMIMQQSGGIYLTDDNGDTWKTAITGKGVQAEILLGEVIIGNNLLIKNSSGKFIMDSNGVEIQADSFKLISQTGENLVDDIINNIQSINDIANDNKITPIEKKELLRELEIITSEKTQIDIQADNYKIINEKNDFDGSYDILYNYLNPLLNNLTDVSDIDGILLRGYFSDYTNKREILKSKIDSITKILIESAQLTADKKRRVFITRPIPPYDIGDLWVQGIGGDMFVCVIPKPEGESYLDSDWVKATKYTDDTVANSKLESTQTAVFNTLTNNGETQGIFLEDGNLYINGSYVKTGTLKGNKVEWNLDNAMLLIGNSVDDYNLYYDGDSLKIRFGSTDKTIDEVIEDIDGKKNITIKVISSEGTALKETTKQTTLSAKVLNWNVDITDTLPESSFNWKRQSLSKVNDEYWNTEYGIGKKDITITTEDVFEQATFECEVTVD